MNLKNTILFIFTLFIFCIEVDGQTIFVEDNFDYGTNGIDLVAASLSVWSNHSGGLESDDVQYIPTGLSYTDYPSSNIGGAANILNSRTGDDSRSFTAQTSGSVYLSALVNVSSATTSTNGEYFLHFGNTSSLYARLYVRKSSSNLLFGISKYNEGATFSSTNFAFNTTYLVVIKYTFLGNVQDDRVDLWVFTSGVPESEVLAGTPTVENITATNNDASSLNSVSLREGSNSLSVTVDGIRVSDDWTVASLPVELTSFSASKINNGIKLDWRTETEVNNYGFEIQKQVGSQQSSVGNWTKIGFVNGHGNSNSPKEYSFVDNAIQSEKYSYRLKQIDNDGTFSYSKIVDVNSDSPLHYELKQNYPNPFNPTTKIKFTLPEAAKVTVKVFNVLGQEVAVLVNKQLEAGSHEVNFDATGLNSGIYFYRIESGDFVSVNKMTLLK